LTGGLRIEIDGARRELAPDALPLSVGGPDPVIPVERPPSDEPLAWIGRSALEYFVQPVDGAPVVCNGSALTTSQWLRAGDTLTVGSTRIEIQVDDDGFLLRVGSLDGDEETIPPELKVVETIPNASTTLGGTPLEPVAFRPRADRAGARPRPRLRPGPVLFWVALGILAVAGWFVLTGRAVEVRVSPEPDRLEVDGGLPGIRLGGRRLLQPGVYRVVAEKDGYRILEEPFEVTRERDQRFEFNLRPNPGWLTIDAAPVEGAVVRIDGEEVGRTPLDPLELEPGEHEVRVESDRHAPFGAVVVVRGAGERQTLEVELSDTWGTVTIRSKPQGAEVRIDGARAGVTPLSLDLAEGKHRYELRRSGFKPRAGRIEVSAGELRELPTLTLEASDGLIRVESSPPGATVTVDGQFEGQSPVEVRVEPGDDHLVELALSGHRPARRTVAVGPEGTEEVAVTLEPMLGEVRFEATPEDAELLVDGISRGPANQRIELVAVPHRIEIRREGYETFRGEVNPQPGIAESIRVELKTPEQLSAERTPPLIRTAAGQEMVLVEGGRFSMGASRREPGRRADETRREIELTRRFYLSVHEVTNADFRKFDPRHVSGTVGGRTLELNPQPVVRVSWADAASYCNWLSDKEGLSPVYRISGGDVVAVHPVATGYRLPTEAEWAWAARYGGGTTGSRKYPWGAGLPAEPNSGNYADESAAEILGETLEGYHDDHPVTASVDAYSPGALGLRQMGGNVAEWVHDVYAIKATTGEPEVDPLGDERGELHVIRGSSWMDSSVSELRLTYRDYGGEPRPDLGFRIARYAE